MYSEIFAAIHHAALRVTDVEEARQRWSRVLGLTGRDLLIKDFTPLGSPNWQTLLPS